VDEVGLRRRQTENCWKKMMDHLVELMFCQLICVNLVLHQLAIVPISQSSTCHLINGAST
jgi:hypothetical protein